VLLRPRDARVGGLRRGNPALQRSQQHPGLQQRRGRAGVGCFCYGSNANIYHNIFTNLRGVYDNSGNLRPGFVIDNGGTNNSFHDNLSNADPQYVDAANHNYAVKSSSPAASWGLWAG
jgi:hypothetical protein